MSAIFNFKDQYINYLAISYLEIFLLRIDPSQKEIDQIEIMLRSMSSRQRTRLKNYIQKNR